MGKNLLLPVNYIEIQIAGTKAQIKILEEAVDELKKIIRHRFSLPHLINAEFFFNSAISALEQVCKHLKLAIENKEI